MAFAETIQDECPPPAAASWVLLSDNLDDAGGPSVSTGLTYECEPPANWLADVMGSPPENAASEDIMAMEPGRRLLDSSLTGSVLTRTLVWRRESFDEVVITFDLKREFLVTRVDLQTDLRDAGAGFTPAMLPADILYSVSQTGTSDWVDLAPIEEIEPGSRPLWVNSRFAPVKTRFLRLKFAFQPGSDLLLISEVRIWGISPETE